MAKSTELKTLKIFTSYWRQHPWLFAGTLLIGPAFVLQNIVSPLFIAQALGQLVAHHEVSANLIWFAALSLLGGATLEFIADYFIGVRLDKLIIRDLYNRCFKHLLQQEYGFFANNFSGSLVTRANRLVKAYETFHITFFLDTLGRFCGVTVALVVMCIYNLAIGLTVTVLWIGSIILIGFMAQHRMPFRRAAVAKESEQTGELADAVTNAFTVKTFATEQFEISRYGRVNDQRMRLYDKSWAIAIRNGYTVNLLCGILQLVILVGGVRAVQTGAISIATFLLFQVYILRIIDSLIKGALIMRQLEGVFGDAYEMTELLEREPLIKDPAKPEVSRITKGIVAFEAINFGYAEQQGDEPLFHDLNLSIKSGEHVGLVGPSGGGKSTVTRLLLRFHDIAGGYITIDGQDIRAIRQADLHQAISYVPQEPILFHRSLAENIAYGKPGASFEEIKRAAKHAHADEFIKQLPRGYDTPVGERGVKLSGGQRQRVAIARAMLKNAPILVLDEATAALDSESEHLIQEALWQLMRGKTALVIAHRLSTIQRMDRIFVLNQGRVIEEGTHKQLLKNGKLYAKLWKHQSGGFIEG